MRLPTQHAKIVGIYAATLVLGLLVWFGVELHRAGFAWSTLSSIDALRALYDIEIVPVAAVLSHYASTGDWEQPPPAPLPPEQPPLPPAPPLA